MDVACVGSMKLSKILFVIVCSAVAMNGLNERAEETLSRKKRWLLFPPTAANVIQLIIGIGVPVEVTPESVVLGWGFRAFYTMPTNLSQLMPMDYGGTSRKERTVSRWKIYKMLERESEMRGHDGRSCVLRSICEVSDMPFKKFHGLFEELLHTIFTPTSTNEEADHPSDNEYYAAQVLGRKYRGKCRQLFPDCTQSLIEMLSHISMK